ncbi:exodeoxyribonuclease VII small subunit [Clostridium isatidis]|uniref:Exodeoxyribonuclease 7 small subunit n=1 Tax=Clostridium isatidis TaxID=182773 RepID=A0A343JAY3_9CLOT|nr:exodeoxyribonuclease VII small subunit [Clostridium isatidis]ASW42691.1 exodeoxyribonuclease VII small subunit [Clostridium isatidis]NLZ33612.1 exodeoxyribonuclease VII small subunit [Clostridiales bacterium]
MAKRESYEDMLNSLQDILNNMENSDLPLEELMKEYETGVKLVNKLYKNLNTLEGKLLKIKENMEVELESENEKV